VRGRLFDRRRFFLDQERLNRLLFLIRLHLNGLVDEQVYTEVISGWLGRRDVVLGPSARCSIRPALVSAQDPAPGTLVPAFGARIPNGANLGPSTVTITLGLRGPGPP
jgi:hypothetical protein